jgi:steroid delta-isomerase-like uncharacterized protein
VSNLRRESFLMPDNTAVIAGYYDAWEARDASALDRFLAEDFVGHDPSLGPDFDSAGLKANLEALNAALPGYEVTREAVVAQDDLVTVRWRTDGTFTPPGSDAGLPVSFTGMTMYRLRDGRIAELWNEWDNQRFVAAVSAAAEGAAAAS